MKWRRFYWLLIILPGGFLALLVFVLIGLCGWLGLRPGRLRTLGGR